MYNPLDQRLNKIVSFGRKIFRIPTSCASRLLRNMNLWISFVLVASIGCGFVNGGNCPPKSQIAPCICKDSTKTATCSNFSNAEEMDAIFKKIKRWDLDRLVIDKCAMEYIPKSIVNQAQYNYLNITSSVFDTMYDEVPDKGNRVHSVGINDLKVLDGFDWKFFTNLKLTDVSIFDASIREFDDSFKKSMSTGIKIMKFEKTRTHKITHQAFANFKSLQVLFLKRSYLKELSRDMFPKPWNTLVWMDFSFNQLRSLPADMFKDIPFLQLVLFEKNLITTIAEKPFSYRTVFKVFPVYYMEGNPVNCNCDIKWYTKSNIHLLFGTCTGPKEFKGRALMSLKTSEFNYCN